MAGIISVNETRKKNRWYRNPRWWKIIAIVVIVAAGSWWAVVAWSGRKTTHQAPQDRVVTLQQQLAEKQKAADKDTNNFQAQEALSDVKSQLANEYIARKQYAEAQALLSGKDNGSLQSLQAEAIIAEQKGDVQAAITALRRQIDYYKALPATDTDYNAEIRRVEARITLLEDTN